MQNTKNIIELYYQHFNNGDMPNMLGLLHDEVAHDVNQGSRQVGKPLFSQFMEHMNNCYKENIHHLTIMVSEDGKKAAAEFIVDGTYLKTDSGLPTANNQTYSVPCGTFFEMKDGKITRVTTYYNLNEWIKQVNG